MISSKLKYTQIPRHLVWASRLRLFDNLISLDPLNFVDSGYETSLGLTIYGIPLLYICNLSLSVHTSTSLKLRTRLGMTSDVHCSSRYSTQNFLSLALEYVLSKRPTIEYVERDS